MQAARPDLVVEGIRGNVDTRLRKLDEGQFDAIVLAAAGLNRLGWSDRIAEYLPVELMCPAVGQGCACRRDANRQRPGDAGVLSWTILRHARPSQPNAPYWPYLAGDAKSLSERTRTLEDGDLHLRAIVISPDGTAW